MCACMRGVCQDPRQLGPGGHSTFDLHPILSLQRLWTEQLTQRFSGRTHWVPGTQMSTKLRFCLELAPAEARCSLSQLGHWCSGGDFAASTVVPGNLPRRPALTTQTQTHTHLLTWESRKKAWLPGSCVLGKQPPSIKTKPKT